MLSIMIINIVFINSLWSCRCSVSVKTVENRCSGPGTKQMLVEELGEILIKLSFEDFRKYHLFIYKIHFTKKGLQTTNWFC